MASGSYIRSGKVKNCSNWFEEVRYSPNHLLKLAQTCKNLPKCPKICPNSQKPCPNAGETLPKHYLSLSFCHANSQTSLARKRIYIRGDFVPSLHKEKKPSLRNGVFFLKSERFQKKKRA